MIESGINYAGQDSVTSHSEYERKGAISSSKIIGSYSPESVIKTMLPILNIQLKYLFALLAITSLIQSCGTKPRPNDLQRLLLEQCNELDIIFYTKNGFIFKDYDSSTIKNYIGLITLDNDNSVPDCKATEKLVFKHNDQELFSADIATNGKIGNISCNAVKYQLNSRWYRHQLTYQTGMGIDQIFWHRVNPQGNPWVGVDSSKFHYEDLGRAY
jgi:hypothetical protein